MRTDKDRVKDMATAAATSPPAEAAEGGKKRISKKLIMLAAPAVLLPLLLGGAWVAGLLDPLLGKGKQAEAGKEGAGEGAEQHGAKPEAGHGAAPAAHGAPAPHGAPAAPAHGAPAPSAHGAAPAAHGDAPAAKAVPGAPVFVEIPDLITNLNTGAKRAMYVKAKVRIEVKNSDDEAALRAVMPRLLDLFQTYLREMRPEELRGSIGTFRLREELMSRANIAAAPVRIQDLLFVELLVQ